MENTPRFSHPLRQRTHNDTNTHIQHSGALSSRKTDGVRLVRSESRFAVNKLIYNRSLAGCD